MSHPSREAEVHRDGLVVAAHGRQVVVLDADDRRWLCHLRGRQLEAVVGDRVHWARSGDEGVVESLQPRRNLLLRQDAWRSKAFAANLDALLMLVAVEPVFSESQLARALIAADAAGIPVWIGLNKMDLPGADAAWERLQPYRDMGVETVRLALKGGERDLQRALGPRLRGRTTLVIGPSGAGKSTLVNRCVPEAQAQVGEISKALRSGRHTTTATRWYALGPAPDAGALIDSPGFQEFGLHHVPPEDLAARMPDLAAHRGACRFYNCTHRNEPGCGIQQAGERGQIAASRLRIYETLYDELSAPTRY